MKNKNKIKQNANNIMWVEYWIGQAHPSFKDYELFAERYDDYRWICEITLPLINKTVRSISGTEINAMLNASKKSAKLIDAYMQEHPELDIRNEFKGKRWEIVGDENGEFRSMGKSTSWRQEIINKRRKEILDSVEAIKKTYNRVAKINGNTKNLFIQVLDQSLFSDDMTINEILNEVNDNLERKYHSMQCMTSYDKDGSAIISIGYVNPYIKEEK